MTTALTGPARLLTTLVLAASLAACAGDEADFEPAIGSNERTESTDALGFAIVTDGDGNGRVVGSLLNTTDVPDVLLDTSVELEDQYGAAQTTMPNEEILLPPGETVELARLPAIGVAGQLPEGRFVELTLDLEVGEDIEILVPVEPQRGPYEEIEVTEAPDDEVSPPA